jgi:hypothetical protein
MMVLERVFGRVFDDADDLGMDIERVDLAGTAVDIEQEVTQLELRLHRGFRGIERGCLYGRIGDGLSGKSSASTTTRSSSLY